MPNIGIFKIPLYFLNIQLIVYRKREKIKISVAVKDTSHLEVIRHFSDRMYSGYSFLQP